MNTGSFKPGDWAFEICPEKGVLLTELMQTDSHIHTVLGQAEAYTHLGRLDPSHKLPSLYQATKENYEKLCAFFGEDVVPKLPLRGSELTKKLLVTQKMQACYCAETNDDDARKGKNLYLIVRYEDGYFWTRGGEMFGSTYTHAIPVDNYGNEITNLSSVLD